MSDTKWRKLFKAVAEARLGLDQMTVKFIGVDEPRDMRFPPSLVCPLAYMDTIEFGPTELRAIEWLEFTADLSELLASVGRFPLAFSEGRTRVTGYADPISGNVR